MRRTFRVVVGAAVVAGLLLVTTAVSSNELQKLGLEAKTRASDVIVLATVKSTHRAPPDNGMEREIGIRRYALLEVDRVVRGVKVPNTIRLVIDGPIPESDPWCCTVGTRVLVFATHEQGNYYWATNGAYGQFVLDGHRVINWPAHAADTWAELDDVLAQISRVSDDAASH